MNYKVKSALYFASLIIAMVTYYTIGQEEIVQNAELAKNTIAHTSLEEALN